MASIAPAFPAQAGITSGWRVAYYGCGLSLAGLSALTPYRIEVSGTFVAFCLVLLAAWYGAAFALWLVRERAADPAGQIAPLWRPAFLSAADRSLLFLTIPLFWAFFAPVKASIPALAGFWADPYLGAADRLLLGRDAWTLTHAVFGTGATAAIDILYALWIPIIILTAFVVAVSGSEETRARFFLGWGLIWLVLGVGGAFALASAGPTFGGHLGFGYGALDERLDDIHGQTTLLAVIAREALWTAYESGNAATGNGISAAPSLHCAITFFLALLARRTAWARPALVYAGIVWVGSVHLGWHYFLDGLISLVGVLILWPLIRRIAAGAVKGR